MKRSRGFRLRRPKLARVFHWMIRPGRKSVCFLNPISGVFALSRWLLHGVKTLCLSGSGPTYIQLGRKESVATPKGHLEVYVADCNGGTRRVLVPVIYFNHPLFEELLNESERVHGYNHPGGITIPEFE
ncbi:hypothetical protein K2173_018148 [Erythroxylum novogranatense]|uniref:Small auxin up regulated protein n=1 Tax=Erythroxylum novogranatense TaxID=1862640 RepID=A0AAV8TL27_9ROSI|nr:hypothetical protein K2173_018148 [Erythroxylum novogranatense]